VPEDRELRPPGWWRALLAVELLVLGLLFAVAVVGWVAFAGSLGRGPFGAGWPGLLAPLLGVSALAFVVVQRFAGLGGRWSSSTRVLVLLGLACGCAAVPLVARGLHDGPLQALLLPGLPAAIGLHHAAYLWRRCRRAESGRLRRRPRGEG